MTDAEVDAVVGRRFRTRYPVDGVHQWLMIIGTDGEQLLAKLEPGPEVPISRQSLEEFYVPVYTTTADMVQEAS